MTSQCLACQTTFPVPAAVWLKSTCPYSLSNQSKLEIDNNQPCLIAEILCSCGTPIGKHIIASANLNTNGSWQLYKSAKPDDDHKGSMSRGSSESQQQLFRLTEGEFRKLAVRWEKLLRRVVDLEENTVSLDKKLVELYKKLEPRSV